MSTPPGRARSQRGAAVRRYVDRAIVTKAVIYLSVFGIALVLGLVDAVRGDGWSWLYLGSGLALGAAVGMVAARTQRFDWNSFEQRVVANVDVVGVVVLVLYVVFAFNRSRLVDAWTPAAYASVAGLGVLAGVMGGQVLGIRHGLRSLGRRVLGPRPQQPRRGAQR